MKKFFAKDTVAVGLVAGIGCELLFCLLLAAGLLLAGQSPASHPRWYAGMFLPMILLLRFYAKRKEQLTVTRTLIVLFFVSFVAFMAYLLSTHQIELR